MDDKARLAKMKAELPAGVVIGQAPHGDFVVRLASPDSTEIARRSRLTVEKWRDPGRVMAYVAREALLLRAKKGLR